MKEKMLEKLCNLAEELMYANMARREMAVKMDILATITDKALQSKYHASEWEEVACLLNVRIPSVKEEEPEVDITKPLDDLITVEAGKEPQETAKTDKEPQGPAKADKEPQKPAKTDKPVKPRKKLDDGKMHALKKAGWTLKQISEEMGCSIQTVAKHLHDYIGNEDEEQPEE